MSTPDRQEFEGLRVLVVDDDRDGAELLARVVATGGHRTAVATGGQAALEQAAVFDPDVILLDLCMPGLDGYGVAQALRERLSYKEPLLVAVTGYDGEDFRRQAEECGISLYLVKPVNVPRLLGLLERFRQAAGR